MADFRIRVFVVLCVASALALAGYLYWAKTRTAAPAGKTAPAPEAMSSAPARMFFRYTGVDANYGKLAFVTGGQPAQPHFVEGLACEVVYVAGGRGICLTAARGVFTTYAAKLFDAASLTVSAEFPLQGIPSRARMSRDGKLAALTVFVTGHSYASTDFSTQTWLVDAAGGRVLANLEDFAVRRGGTPFKHQDFNFWGVTFTADAKRFYATLSTQGQHFLVAGDIAGRSVEVIHDNVECPSLSPDGRRVAYKKRYLTGGRVGWQLHTLELASGVETPIAEKRSIDDQLEWLDDVHVLYTVPAGEARAGASTDVWRAGIDGKSAPELFLRNAYSPSAQG